MNKFVFTLCIAYSLLWPASVLAQTLWQETSYGMSVQEVRNIVSAAIAPNSKPNRLASGAEEQLRIENFDLVGKKFTVSFYFLEGKLTQVTLSLEGRHSYASAMLVFNSLTDSLRSKYGRELSSRTTKGALSTASANWQSSRTNINLFVMAVGGADAALNVNYQVRVAQDADKL